MDANSQQSLAFFRPMALEDIVRVHEIDVASFSLPWSERSFRFELTENQNSILWVAEVRPADQEQPRVVGMVVIWVILDEAHVATIATDPAFRGQGIGRRLLANGLLAAYERGARVAFLEVRRGNLTAQTLYHQFGFQVVGERPRYYQDNHEDALLMTLETLELQSLLHLVA